MREVIYYCDICGKKHDSSTNVSLYVDGGGVINNGKRDICSTCFNEIYKFMEQLEKKNNT